MSARPPPPPPFRDQLARWQAAGRRHGGGDGGALPGQHAAHHRADDRCRPGARAGVPAARASSSRPWAGSSASCSPSSSRSRSSTSPTATPRSAGSPGGPRCWPPPSRRCSSRWPSGCTASTWPISPRRGAGGRRQHRRGGAVHSLGLLHRHRLPARRRSSRRPGSCARCSSAARHPRLTATGTRSSGGVPCTRRSRSLARPRRDSWLDRLLPSGAAAERSGGGTGAAPLAAADIGGHSGAPIPRSPARGQCGRRRRRWPRSTWRTPRCCRPTRPRSQGREAIQKFWGGLLDAYTVTVRDRVRRDRGPGRPGLRPGTLHARRRVPRPRTAPPSHDEGKFVEILQAAARRQLALRRGHVQLRSARRQVDEFRFPRAPGVILRVPQVRRAPAREPRQDLAGSSAKRCPVSLRGA